jgi:hypothetical protein
MVLEPLMMVKYQQTATDTHGLAAACGSKLLPILMFTSGLYIILLSEIRISGFYSKSSR